MEILTHHRRSDIDLGWIENAGQRDRVYNDLRVVRKNRERWEN